VPISEIDGERIATIGPGLAGRNDTVVDLDGSWLLS
jgi:hypothetical protein